MTIHPASLLLGAGLAWALPLLGRVLRPVAVQATTVGMDLFDEGRRVVAEQAEMIEDIAAEARARRDESNGHHDDEAGAAGDEVEEAVERPRRRANGAAVRRRAG
jgi:hypothetical protein